MLKVRPLGILLLWVFGAASTVQAQPRLVLLFRHAEESATAGVHLSNRGYSRAFALPKLVREQLGTVPLGEIYAQDAKDSDSSLRSVETAKPIAASLNHRLNRAFHKGESKKLMKDLARRSAELRGKAVVIVWSHQELPEIAERLGVRKEPDWSNEVYDRFWRLEFGSSGQLLKFEDLPQRLLPGDPSR